MSTGTSAIEDLEEVLRARLGADPSESYSARLYADRELLQRKVMEEAFEVCLELGRTPRDRDATVAEAADLVYHLLAGLVQDGISCDDVAAELARRRR